MFLCHVLSLDSVTLLNYFVPNEMFKDESTETAAVAKGCAGDAAATLKEAPQAVAVKDFEPSESSTGTGQIPQP